MPVVVEYVVERAGTEKMTFASKAEADAYDKLLDTADNISQLLSKSQLIIEEKQIDKLALYLAKNRDNLITALAQRRKPTPSVPIDNSKKNQKNKKSDFAAQSLLDIVIEPDEDIILDNTEEIIDQSGTNEDAA